MRYLILFALLAARISAHAATFGDQNSYGSNFTLKDNVGAFVASPAQSGICDSITVYLKFNFDSCKTRCALYTLSGSDTVLVANGVTEERRFEANGAFIWHGFAFSNPKPSVSAGATYFIAAFGDSAGTGPLGTTRGASVSGGGMVVNKAAAYESGMPGTLNPSTSITNNRFSIYVTYTPVSKSTPRRRLITSRSQPAS